MADPLVSRVYDLKVAGYDDSMQKVKAMTDAFTKMDAAKAKLNAQLQKKLNAGDTTVVQQLTTKIKELQIQMSQLSDQRNAIINETEAVNSTTGQSVSAYSNLVRQYKEAKTNAQEMATQFGAQSEQAKIAAAAMLQYKEQLAEVNALVKNGGVKSPVAAQTVATPPITSNTGTGKNISEYDLLVQKYREAVAASQQLALQYGIESKEAIAAAQAAAAYNAQISQIKDFVKSGGANPATTITENTTIQKNIVDYKTLTQQYKESVIASQELAVQFGAESTEAKAAAASAAEYKKQLDAINQVPFTTNLDDLAAERESLTQTGAVVNDLDKAQVDAQLTAQQWAASQRTVVEDIKNSGSAVEEIKGSLDQYTGTLRQNITAQIENAQSLKVNSAEQKEIQAAMKEAGGATQEQVTRLAQLKEQVLILTETNKQLTVTVRNQAQEFIAGTGSMDEMQAKINQLQQAYEQLTEAERASSFGQGIKAEIDILEPKIKELEGTIGRFQRNVGNYPTAFSGAFKALNNEIDSIQGKLIKGNFSGKEFDELTAKQNALSRATQLVGKEFATTAAEANAYKQAATEIGLAYGKDSQVFKSFSSEVSKGTGSLKEIQKETNTAASGTGKLVTGFKSVFSVLRNIANIIPGLGIGSLVLLLITPLQLLAASFVNLFKTINEGKIRVAALNEVNLKAIEIYNKEKTEIQALASVASDNNISLKDRKTALDQLIAISPDYLRGLNLENIATAEGRKILDDYIASLQKKAELQASLAVNEDANKVVADLKAQKEALEEMRKSGKVAFGDLTEELQKFVDNSTSAGRMKFTTDLFNLNLNKSDLDQVEKNIDDAIQKASLKVNASLNIFKNKFKENLTVGDNSVKGIIENIQKKISDLQKIQPTLISVDAIKKNVAEIKTLQDQLDALLGKTKEPKKGKGSRLDLGDKEEIKLIEANRATLLAIENTSVNEIQKIRELSFNEEKAHLLKVEQINVDALNKKIDLLSRKKKLNAEEKKQIAEFAEQRSSIELETSKKINDLLQKDFDERAKKFKENLDRQIENAKAANKQIQDSSEAAPSTKAQASVDLDNAILRAQVEFFLQMDSLEKAYNKTSKKNAEDRARDIKASNDLLNKDRKDLSVSVLADIDKQTDADIERIKLKYDKLIQDILNSKKSIPDKEFAIKVVTNTQNVETSGRDLKGNNDKLVKAKELLDAGLITMKQYEEIYAKTNKAQQDLNKAIEEGTDKASSFIDVLNKLFGFKKGSDQAKAVGEIITQAYDLAGQAMNSYYDQEAQRIQRSNKITQDKLDIELQQAKNRAQSQAEEDSLDRQFAAKKEKANKDAFEKDKKLKKEQLTINFAIQLANIAVAASANPLNAFTFGAAGIAQYIIQAAIATGAYLLNLGNINSAQYATGGKVVKPTKVSNGKINNPPNIPVQPNGDNIYATVKTNEVILNEEQQRRLGGPSVFKAIGVPGFADGGYTGMFGNLGKGWDRAQAPINPNAYLNPGKNSNSASSDKTEAQMNKLMGMIAETSRQTNQRIDKLKVVLDPNAVQKANDKTKKATAIGTL